MPRKKKSDSEKVSEEQELKNLEWLREKNFYLDANQWQRLKDLRGKFRMENIAKRYGE